MRITSILVVLGFIVFGIGISVNDAEAAGYIKFDGIDGEATDNNHENWINLLAFDNDFFPLTNSLFTKGETDALDEIVISKNLDKSSPKLAEAIAMGKIFPKVLIEFCNDGFQCLLSYDLTNVMITSYSINGSGTSIPTEEISLNYEKIIYSNTSDSTKKIPDWIKSTAKFWVDRNVSDREFIDALGFLVKERIIEVEVQSQLEENNQFFNEKPEVPAWIAQTTDWWINSQVPEDQFLEGIKWMIKNKIIRGL